MRQAKLFAIYEFLRSTLFHNINIEAHRARVNGSESFAVNFISGGLTGAIIASYNHTKYTASSRLYPNRKATNSSGVYLEESPRYKGLTDAWIQSLRREGFVRFYRYLPLESLAISAYHSLYFGLYDSLKPVVYPSEETRNSFLASFGLAWVTTAFATFVTRPLYIVSNRVQAYQHHPDTKDLAVSKQVVSCIKRIVTTDGYGGLVMSTRRLHVSTLAAAGLLSGFDKLRGLYSSWRSWETLEFVSSQKK